METSTSSSLLFTRWVPPKPSKPRLLTVRSAISRSKKEETVASVKTQLEDCHMVAAIEYTGFTVKQFQDLRRAIPETSKLLVAKNRLVLKAMEGTPWEAIRPCMKGMNVFLFVHSEEIPEAIKPFRDFQRDQKLDNNNEFAGAVFEGKYYAPEDFKQLETMPSRAELYASILGALQGPAIGLVSTLQAPARDVLMLLKAYVKKLEDQGAE